MRRRSSLSRRSYRTSKTSRTVVPEPSGRDQTSSMISASRSPRTLRIPGRSGRKTLISGSEVIALLLSNVRRGCQVKRAPVDSSIEYCGTLVKGTTMHSRYNTVSDARQTKVAFLFREAAWHLDGERPLNAKGECI